MSLRCLHIQPAGQHRQPLLNLASRQHKVHDGQVATQTAAVANTLQTAGSEQQEQRGGAVPDTHLRPVHCSGSGLQRWL